MLIKKKANLLLFIFIFILLFNAIALHIKTGNIVQSNILLVEKRNVALNFLELKYFLKKLQEIAIYISFSGSSDDLINLKKEKVNFEKLIKEIKKNALGEDELKEVKQINLKFNSYYKSLLSIAEAGIQKRISVVNQNDFMNKHNDAMNELNNELALLTVLKFGQLNDIKNRIIETKEIITESIALSDMDGVETIKERFIKKLNRIRNEVSFDKDKLKAFENLYINFFDTGYKMAEASIFVLKSELKVKEEMFNLQKISSEFEKEINVITSIEIVELENISEENKNSISSTQVISKIANFCIAIGVLLLFFTLKNIVSSISNLQNGLINFFKYINKEKSTVDHLDDSANDEIGNMAKIINENVVKTKSLIEQDAALISDVTRVVEQVKEGYLNNRVEKTTENESLQRLQIQLNEMLNNLETNIGKDTNIILDVLSKYGQLDFRDNIKNASGQVENAVNDLSKIINQMLAENKENGLTLDASSDILLENVDTLNTNSTTTAAALEETAAALEEITSTIINNTESISTMASYSNELSDSIKVGQELASTTVKAMDEINDQTEAIADAITVIDQIAFQTNILSLNAAVEAATAGEAGKGFAVVAQEVRNLAARSAEAAKEIKDLVENATAKTNAGKDGADKMISGYASLNESIVKTTELINTIAEASKEQRTGIEQINDAVTQLDQQTQQNVVISNTTQSIAAQTDEIAKLVVSSANEKEFIGKDEIKSKEVKTSTKSASEILADIKSSTKVFSTPRRTPVTRESTSNKIHRLICQPNIILRKTNP